MSQTIDFSTPPSLVTLDHKARRVVDPGAEACLRAWQVVWCEASYWRRCEERANAAATAAEARAASDALGGRLERLHASMRAEQTRLREVRYPAAVAAMAAHGGQLERSMSLLWAVDGWGWTALHYSANYGHTAVVQLLLDAGGASGLRALRTAQGQSARQLAEANRHFEVMAAIDAAAARVDPASVAAPRRTASPAYRRRRHRDAGGGGAVLRRRREIQRPPEEKGALVLPTVGKGKDGKGRTGRCWIKVPAGAAPGARLRLTVGDSEAVRVALLAKPGGRRRRGKAGGEKEKSRAGSKKGGPALAGVATAELALPAGAAPGDRLEVLLRRVTREVDGLCVLEAVAARGAAAEAEGFADLPAERAALAARGPELAALTEVRKTPSWPRSWTTLAFSSCIPTGMHGPTCICWANLTPFSLEAGTAIGRAQMTQSLAHAAADADCPGLPGAFKRPSRFPQ
jgi:hypothetical protein